MVKNNTEHDELSQEKDETTEKTHHPRFRCTDKQYRYFLEVLLSFLKKNKERGVTIDEIINEMRKNIPETLYKNHGDEFIDADFVNRLLKTLKKYSCTYTYSKKDNCYRIDDANWMFPIEILLTPLSQLALKLGWDLLLNSVGTISSSQKITSFDEIVKRVPDIEKGKYVPGPLTRVSSVTYHLLYREPCSCFYCKELIPMLSNLPLGRPQIDETVFLNIFTAWVNGHLLSLIRKDQEKIYFWPENLMLDDKGWHVQGLTYVMNYSGNIPKLDLCSEEVSGIDLEDITHADICP